MFLLRLAILFVSTEILYAETDKIPRPVNLKDKDILPTGSINKMNWHFDSLIELEVLVTHHCLSRSGRVDIKKNKAWKKCDKSRRKLVDCTASGHEFKLFLKHEDFESQVICEYIDGIDIQETIKDAVTKDYNKKIEKYKKSEDFKRAQGEDLQNHLNEVIRKRVAKSIRKLKFHLRTKMDSTETYLYNELQDLLHKLSLGADHFQSLSLWSTDPIVIPTTGRPLSKPSPTDRVTPDWMSWSATSLTWNSLQSGSHSFDDWYFPTHTPPFDEDIKPPFTPNGIAHNEWIRIDGSTFDLRWRLEYNPIEIYAKQVIQSKSVLSGISLYRDKTYFGGMGWNQNDGFAILACTDFPWPQISEYTIVISKSESKFNIYFNGMDSYEVAFKLYSDECKNTYTGNITTKITLNNLNGAYYRKANLEMVVETVGHNNQQYLIDQREIDESISDSKIEQCQLTEIMSNSKHGVYYMGAEYIYDIISTKTEDQWMLYIKYMFCTGYGQLTEMRSVAVENFLVKVKDEEYYFIGTGLVMVYNNGLPILLPSQVSGTLPTTLQVKYLETFVDADGPLLSFNGNCANYTVRDGLINVQINEECKLDMYVPSYRELNMDEQCKDYQLYQYSNKIDYLVSSVTFSLFSVSTDIFSVSSRCAIGQNVFSSSNTAGSTAVIHRLG